MTLQFPRYSEDGLKLEESDYDYSVYFRQTLAESYSHKIPFLTAAKAWELGVLVGIAREISSASDLEEKQWIEAIYVITGDSWTEGARKKAAEEYIEKLFPLLEPPIFRKQ